MSIEHNDHDLTNRIAVTLESIADSMLRINSTLEWIARKSVGPVQLDLIPGIDDLTNVSDVSEVVDAAFLAREAEQLLNAASTPDVRTRVEVGEGEKAEPLLDKINLFHQDRSDIEELVENCKNDPLIMRYVELREKDAKAGNILGAAIALVYKYLPPDLWGSTSAIVAVQQFVKQHSEEGTSKENI